MQDCAIVYGALRSGTTMLRLMIDAHPALCCTGEHDYLFETLRPAGAGWRYDRAALDDDRRFRGSGLVLRDDLDGAAALDDLIAQIARKGGGRRPVLMLHRAVDRWAALRPDVPVVHFLRDPRDVARSSIGMGWAGNAWRGVDHWIATEREWRTAPPEVRARALTSRYEDLLAAPEAELTRICGALGVAFDPAMLRYPERTTYAAPDPRLAHQWRGKASRDEVRLVEGAVGELLTEAGYDPSGFGPRHPGPLERRRLILSSKLATFRFGVRRFGLATTLRARLGRALGLPALERRAHREMDAATRRHLK